jgi:hypothetical protein
MFDYFIFILAARNGLPWNPSVYATNLSQHLNARSVSAMRLLAFFKQIPEFNQLNVDDKLILSKYNLMLLIILNNALSFKIDTKQIIETDTDVPWNSTILRAVHGNEIYMQVTSIFEPYVRIAKYDGKIIQLALIVFMLTIGLSTGDGAPEPILNDGMAVYRAQSSYMELLWKYLEIVYGFEQAFRIITTLITRFLTWQLIEKKLRYNVEQRLSKTDENDLLPLMKSLFHIS